MDFYFILAIAALLAGQIEGKDEPIGEVCYGDLGCFSNAPPFTAPGRTAKLPQSPEICVTEFWLFTRHNSVTEHKIRTFDVESLRSSSYDGSKPTKFIIHGYLDRPTFGTWMQDMSRQFLVTQDMNVFVVDWRKGNTDFYPQAAANARLVGAQIAQFGRFLVNQTGTSFSKFHVLGHSLGGQVAAYAGQNMPGLGRITGLDPAGPFFQNVDNSVRLDSSDAAFVDIIHVDSAEPWDIENVVISGLLNGASMMEPVGHVDVYPNGGTKQPGCKFQPITLIIKDGIVEGMRYTVACSHMRALDYMFESISSSCPWRSYRCEGGYEEFKTGRCLRCPADGGVPSKYCNGLGYTVTKAEDGSAYNKFYMVTGDRSPFCRYHFHVQLKLTAVRNRDQTGKVWVKFTSSNGQTGFLQLGDSSFHLRPGGTYDFLVASQEEARGITAVELKWEHDASIFDWLKTPAIFPDSVQVFSGEFQQEVKFCDNDGELKSKNSRLLTRTCY